MKSWYDRIVAGLIAAAIADVIFGLDAVLNALSVTVVIVLVAMVVVGLAAAILALGAIIIRDAVHEIRIDLQQKRAWRWRCVGWAGIVGMLMDGAVGAWNAYQEHIFFSTAVEQIPFAGVPVFVALGSYPLRWIEAFLMKWHRHRARLSSH